MAPKILSNFAWVASAADPKSLTPALRGINSDGTEIAATNRHILFIAPGHFPLGLLHAKTFDTIDAKFPDYKSVVPKKAPSHNIDVPELVSMARANVAYCKSIGKSVANLPIRVGDQALNSAYLILALFGATTGSAELTVGTTPRNPLRIDMAERCAVIMPVDCEVAKCKFDGSHALTEISKDPKQGRESAPVLPRKGTRN